MHFSAVSTQPSQDGRSRVSPSLIDTATRNISSKWVSIYRYLKEVDEEEGGNLGAKVAVADVIDQFRSVSTRSGVVLTQNRKS